LFAGWCVYVCRSQHLGADPRSIKIDPSNSYAYIGDYDSGKLYVLDINPNSDKYHQVIDTITLSGATNGLRNLEFNGDGSKLFATAPLNTLFVPDKIYVFGIDSRNAKPLTLLGEVNLERNGGLLGISSTPDPDKMLFTNSNIDFKGVGRLKVTGDSPDNFTATVEQYIPLTLGSISDFLDVNEATSVTITRDGKYAFVGGRNSRGFGVNPAGDGAFTIGIDPLTGQPYNITNPNDSRYFGSNVGIIKNPLADDARLVAATQPIKATLNGSSSAFLEDVNLSNNDNLLFAAYPFDTSGGSVGIFDVNKTINLVETTAPNILASQYLGFNNPNYSPIYITRGGGNPVVTETSTKMELVELVPIKDVTSVSNDDKTTTVLAPTFQWKYINGLDTSEIKRVNLFVSTFPKTEGLTPYDELVDVDNVLKDSNLSRQQKLNLLSSPWYGGKKTTNDFNPDRILTATWANGIWSLINGLQVPGPIDPNNPASNTSFKLPYNLTVGQTYYWTVEVIGKNPISPNNDNLLNRYAPSDLKKQGGEFQTVPPQPTVNSPPFSSVTVLTHGFNPLSPNLPRSIYDLGYQIADVGKAANSPGVVMRYDHLTGYWVPIDKDRRDLLNPNQANYLTTLDNYLNNYQYRPIVLLADWAKNNESVINDSGFSEGAADAFFASLVQLDQLLGGSIGEIDAQGRQVLYDQNGKLIRKRGELFKSPLHFIGFSRGTVVNSEIVQRLGTFYPGVYGKNGLDLQMTTIDPHDFYQPSLEVDTDWLRPSKVKFGDFYDPKVQVWDNVTYADNYYQTVPSLNEVTGSPSGRPLSNLIGPDRERQTNELAQYPGLDFPKDANGFTKGQPDDDNFLGGLENAQTQDSKPLADSRAGFTRHNNFGDTHGRALAWYAGTANLGWTTYPTKNDWFSTNIQRRRSDFHYSDMFDKDFYARFQTMNYWYESVNANKPPYKPVSEGVGEGWYYSVLGGGQSDRKYTNIERVPVTFDNTLTREIRGDFAIPTLFNGNFDASRNVELDARKYILSEEIAGWSSHNGGGNSNSIDVENLVDWREIEGLTRRWDGDNSPNYLEKLGINPLSPNYQPNYALKLNSGESIVHNRFVVPDWGTLRFNLHVPEEQLNSGRTVVLTWQDASGNDVSSPFEIYLEAAPTTTGATQNSYVPAFNRIGYGTKGFETFTANVPNELRGKIATLKFEVKGSGYVYLDDVFFKSQHLLFGNPTEARTTENPIPNQYYNNYLIEKPQYTVSYSGDSNIPNWSSWQINKTWLGSEDRPSDYFFRDPALTSLGLISAKDTDYDRPQANIVDSSGYPVGKPNASDTPYKLAPGHLTANADRNRHQKDQIATYSTINIVPQHPEHNSPLWARFEDFTRKVVTEQGRDVYVIAGGVGEKDSNTDKANINVPATATDPAYALQVPSHLWKVLLILDEPILGIQDITLDNATALAVYTENVLPEPGNTPYTRWNEGGMQIMTVAELETILNNDPNNKARNIQYSFFSELPDNIRTAFKTNPVTVPSGTTPYTAF
jgi:DNA/RNA endonuclease G (NUC1)